MSGDAGDKKKRIDHAQTDWDADAPRSVFFNDVYFTGDGLEETAHVFLRGNDLADRFQRGGRFSIGELGFGTGLNMLAAWKLWRQTTKPENATLSLLSVEAFPLNAEDLARVHKTWPDLSNLSARLRTLLPPPVRGLGNAGGFQILVAIGH